MYVYVEKNLYIDIFIHIGYLFAKNTVVVFKTNRQALFYYLIKRNFINSIE